MICLGQSFVLRELGHGGTGFLWYSCLGRSVDSKKSNGLDVSNSILCSSSRECLTAGDDEA